MTTSWNTKTQRPYLKYEESYSRSSSHTITCVVWVHTYPNVNILTVRFWSINKSSVLGCGVELFPITILKLTHVNIRINGIKYYPWSIFIFRWETIFNKYSIYPHLSILICDAIILVSVIISIPPSSTIHYSTPINNW